jgi:ABC-type uncharacterized transport system fused permease/ATPase subunit
MAGYPLWASSMDEALSGIGEAAEIEIIKSLMFAEFRDTGVVYVSHRPTVQALFEKRISLTGQ